MHRQPRLEGRRAALIRRAGGASSALLLARVTGALDAHVKELTVA